MRQLPEIMRDMAVLEQRFVVHNQSGRCVDLKAMAALTTPEFFQSYIGLCREYRLNVRTAAAPVLKA